MVIRLWCTAAIATFLLLAYAMILNFKVADDIDHTYSKYGTIYSVFCK